jgi:quinol monooxygenase YgiN
MTVRGIHRSRVEPGCLSHAVYRDAENPLRLVFVEEWEDRTALAAHFAVPASRAFAARVQSLAAEPRSDHAGRSHRA